MDPSTLSPDEIVYAQWGFFKLNATILNTWVVMAVLVIGSALAARRLSSGKHMSRWQNLLEVIVGFLRNEIRQLSNQSPDRYLPFIGTIFLFIALSTVLGVIPGLTSPAGSLSTTAALSICVFFAVPIFGIAHQGVGGYLKNYVRPSPFMLPFNIIGELSRTLALAVRLFGNVMSGTKIVGILLLIVPFIFPVVMDFLGLFFGIIQAYIFAVLAMVYIASGLRAREQTEKQAVDRAAEADATEAITDNESEFAERKESPNA